MEDLNWNYQYPSGYLDLGKDEITHKIVFHIKIEDHRWTPKHEKKKKRIQVGSLRNEFENKKC